jgi:hypothetical protein
MDYDVWCEFLDPSARITEEDFNLMTLVERMAYISGPQVKPEVEAEAWR